MKSLNLNNVVVSGNLVQDPRVVATAGGGVLTNMRIAINNYRKEGDGWKTEPVFINVVTFKSLGPELVKGVQVLIQGKLSQSNRTAKNGEKRTDIEIIAFNVNVLVDAPAAPPEYEDDIPF